MASSGSESSGEVVDEERDAENASGPSSPRPRRRSARNAVRALRNIIFDDTTFAAEHLNQEEEASTSNAASEHTHRRIESSDDEANDGEKKKRRRLEPEDNGEAPVTNCTDDTDDAFCCSICFEEFTNAGPHRLVCLKCGHIFGQSCIEKWIRSEKNAKCPQCKARTRIADVRRIFARAIKMIDTTEMELLKESNKTFKAENEGLRIEITELKMQLRKAKEHAASFIRTHPDTSHSSQAKTAFPLALTLRTGPSMAVSNESGSRYLDAAGDSFVITCSMDSGLFMPFGLKLISKDGRVKVVVPVHSKKPRCCSVSPFDNTLVLSTGEDKTLCVTKFTDGSGTVLNRFELPANGWTCCWLTENEVAAGLINGRVYKFDLTDSAAVPVDMTDGSSRFPIIAIYWLGRASSLFVVSIRECCFYRHQKKTSVASGSIMSFCWSAANDCFMLSFSPTVTNQFTDHVLYKVSFDGILMAPEEIGRYQSRSNKQTRMTRCALWSSQNVLFSAVFDEAHSELVIFNWDGERRVATRYLRDEIIAIKELECRDEAKVRLACLSEKRVYFYELSYS